jgi:hypothetical protein
MSHRTAVLALPCDYGAVHHYLTREIDFHTLDYTALLSRARHVLAVHPPERVEPASYRQLVTARSTVTAYPFAWQLTRTLRVTPRVTATPGQTSSGALPRDPRWLVMFVLELAVYSALLGYMLIEEHAR